MANRFYIPQQRDPMTATSDLALRLIDMRRRAREADTRSELLKEDIATRRRGNELQAEKQVRMYGGKLQSGQEVEGIEPRKVSALETQATAEASRAAAKVKERPQDKDFGMLHVSAAKKILERGFTAGIGKTLIKDLESFVDKKDATTGYVYKFLKPPQNMEYYRKSMLEEAMKAKETATPAQQIELDRTIEALQHPDASKGLSSLVDMVFGPTSRALRMEEAAANTEKGFTLGEGQIRYDAQGNVIAEGKEGDQYEPPYLDDTGNLLQKNKRTGQVEKITSPPTGWTIESDGAGGFRMVQGPTAMMERKTKGDIEGKLIDAGESIARLEEIAESYKPEFLQLYTKLDTLNTKWQEIGKGTAIEKGLSALFGKATPEDRQKLEEYSAFKRDSINNINLYIKEITGAQMSEKEADRIRKAMPDPGEGIFDGNSPSQFESKWKSTMKSMRAAQARYIYYLKNGFKPEEISRMVKSNTMMSLNDIRNRINERAAELSSRGMEPDQIRAELKTEFFTMEGM